MVFRISTCYLFSPLLGSVSRWPRRYRYHCRAGPDMNFSYGELEQLFDRQRHVLLRRLTALVRSREQAADLVQEAFTRLLNLVRKQEVTYPEAFLYRTAINLAIDYLRGRSRRMNSLSDDATYEDVLMVAALTPAPDRELSAKQQLRIVSRAITELPERTREAFLLHRVNGYSYPKIAAQLGISESAVEKLISRAIKHCSDSLELPDLE
ncbi:MAG: RNA polymerase sigma factor [Nitrospira sp.]